LCFDEMGKHREALTYAQQYVQLGGKVDNSFIEGLRQKALQ